MAAIECNLFEGATGDFLLIRGNDSDGQLIALRVTVQAAARRDDEGWPWWQPGGVDVTLTRWGRVNRSGKSTVWRDELDFRGPKDVERAYGEWNRLELVCAGSRIEAFPTAPRLTSLPEVWPRTGKIFNAKARKSSFADWSSNHDPRLRPNLAAVGIALLLLGDLLARPAP